MCLSLFLYENEGNPCLGRELPSSLPRGLLAEVQLLYDSTVALDVHCLQVLQQLATLTDHTQHSAMRTEVVKVALEVLRKVGNTVRKQGNLTLGRTRVRVRLAVLTEKLLLFLCC